MGRYGAVDEGSKASYLRYEFWSLRIASHFTLINPPIIDGAKNTRSQESMPEVNTQQMALYASITLDFS
jgi:hypothetical protein